MTDVYLYDDARARLFEPFALTRPLGELVVGVALQRERWQTALQLPVAGHITAPHLAEFEEIGAVGVARGGVPAGSIIVNSRFVPKLSAIVGGPVERGEPLPDLWMAQGEAVAARTPRELPVSYFSDGRMPVLEVARSSAETTMIEGWWLEEIWDTITLLEAHLTDDLLFLQRPALGNAPVGRFRPPPSHAVILGNHPVFVAAGYSTAGEVVVPGATIEPHVVFDATAGPICVNHGSTVNAFTRLVGPCYVGRNSTVLGDRVTACSIGDVCKVRGELSHTIMLGHANKGHDGFVGHSYLGRWVNLGAGTITSNLKNTYSHVALWTPAGVRDTGMQFLGTLFGDHAKTGIGTCLTTGTVLGAGANVYGAGVPPKAVPPFAWGSEPPYEVYRLDKFLEVAERMMARRQVSLTPRARQQLAAAHAARWTVENSE